MSIHLYFQPQLDSIIDELISKGLTLPELTEPLSKPDWHREIPYRDVKIHFLGKYNIDISDWIILHTLIQGDYKTFAETLQLQLSITIESRWEIEQRHEQEDYTANFKPQLQEVVGL